MNIETITLDRDEALKLWKKYQAHRLTQTKVDEEISRVYRMIAQGKVLVDALAAIANGGADEYGRPLLAIVRADQPRCFCDIRSDGSLIMWAGKTDRWGRRPWLPQRLAASMRFDFPADTLPRSSRQQELDAITPHIPPEHRPRRGLPNYHIIFEAEWRRAIPVDPMLVRRIGKSNLWTVLAAWDLTPVERAVLAGHIGAPQ